MANLSYNYTLTGDTKSSFYLNLNGQKALSNFISKHGGELESYELVAQLHKELRASIVEAYTAIQHDAEYYLRTGKFDEPVKYEVKISQAEAEASRDELEALLEQNMVTDLEDEIPF
tara:strand:+ start:210 stop:560 length:351 start_codon:yes stop_codon:yes gene_type:complete